MKYSLALACVAVCATAFAPGPALSQDPYPSRPVEMIVNFGAGGGADQLGRLIARQLEPTLGVSVPVLNIAGASGNTGLARVAAGGPEGYSIGTLTGITVSSWATGMSQLKLDDFAH